MRDRLTDTVQVNGGVGTVAKSLVANARLNSKTTTTTTCKIVFVEKSLTLD